MPASLLQLKIRGVRSYSPFQHKTQTIDFMPLTLIVGSNGSGKTTVIEALKFCISGDEPPLSDSRRNFVHTSKHPINAFDKNISFAAIELLFNSHRNELIHAKREVCRPCGGKGAPTPGITSCYRIVNGPWKHVHKQEDWCKTIPALFNLPNKAIVSHVILCHQDDNLWCMADSSTVKQIFDRIFGCEQYKKEIKHIDAEIKNCKSDLALAERDLLHNKERVEALHKFEAQAIKLKTEIEKINQETSELDGVIETLSIKKNQLKEEITIFERKQQDLELQQCRIIESEEREMSIREKLKNKPIEESEMSNEKLNAKLQEHIELGKMVKSKTDEYCAQEDMIKKKIRNLESDKEAQQNVINKLQVIELKSRDTKENLAKELLNIKKEYNLEKIDEENFKPSIDALSDFEKDLRQHKCDQAEVEEGLATKQLKLNREINKLEGIQQGLTEIIKNKEAFLRDYQHQLAKLNPLSKNVLKIQTNMGRMHNLTDKMSQSIHVLRLIDVINETDEIVSDVVKIVEHQSVTKISKAMREIEAEILDKKNDFIMAKNRKEELAAEIKKTEEDLMMARSGAKDAHNKVVLFGTKRKGLTHLYEQYTAELAFISNKCLSSRLEEIKQITREHEEKSVELVRVQENRMKLSDDYSSSCKNFEELTINQNLRTLKAKIASQKEIERELKDFLKKNDQSSHLKERIRELEIEELKLRDRRSMLAGSKVRIEGETYRVKLELESHKTTLFKNAETLGKVVCNKMILQDLEKLKQCFNQSIMTFHNQMIIKINEVLKLRWRKIYQGSDIEYIELIDEEITRNKNQKGYNYYISMTKNGIRMKMREKGSAGQKALASIIMRMALGELFVKDFAFIALDEPTANLDLANVQSLAKTIGNYVKRRTKRGYNIQWVIITHDEQFLKALDGESSPFYYRLTLDNESCSKVDKISYEEAQQTTELPADKKETA